MYGIDIRRTSVAFCGANIEDSYSITSVDQRFKTSEIQLLCPSTDWHRKGVDLAIEFANHLRTHTNQTVKLIITGHLPNEQKSQLPPDTYVTGWLDKSDPEDIEKITELYQRSDYVVLPSRHDCTPVAISEAFCHGVPVIAAPVGGIPEMVTSDRGYVIPHDAFSTFVPELKNDTYLEMAKSARKAYETSFNWDVWVKHVEQIYDQL